METTQILRIVVASPGDVRPERDTLEKVAADLNRGVAAMAGLRLEVSRWETDAFPGFHAEGPQGLIDPILRIKDCDLLVGIFWKHFGTPTAHANSGTEHEFRTAYDAWKNEGRPQIMVYFNEKPYAPKSQREAEQWGKVLEFRQNFPKEGLWWPYKGKAQFEERLRNHLTQWIRQRSVAQPPPPSPLPSAGEGMGEGAANPFAWRQGITSAEDFFNRDNEQRTLRNYLWNRQNCQIVGARRIGKTSLLRQVERVASTWERAALVAYLDLQDARCYTLSGWLGRAARQFGWPTPPTNLAEFADRVEDTLSAGRRPVLCLDEFEELTKRPAEFPRDFFVNLRACGQQGMSIVTASQKPLSQLTDPGDPTSPFFNTFAVLRLGLFSREDAEDFVTTERPGMAPFTIEDKAEILRFANGHPLALQVACFYVVEAKETGDSLTAALRNATDEMRALLPTW